MEPSAVSRVAAPEAGRIEGGHLEDPLGLMGRRDFSLLIVDDSPGLRQEVRRLVERLGLFSSCREAENGIEGYKEVLAGAPDLILCDLVMPSVDGFKFLNLVRARPDLRDIPVILLTGRTEVGVKIRGLELGASDYVTKPFDPGELLARIKVQLKIKALQDALRASNEQLRELSSVDPLTKLFNRRYFMQALEAEYARSARYGTPLAFLMLDIDHFKRLNDTYGHQAGDEVLRGLADLLRVRVRGTDVAGRYGGEEFCVLLPHTGLPGAAELAERIRAAVEGTPIEARGERLGITVSVGAAACPGPRVATADDLIRLADEALYEAKAAGRNRVATREP
ncbi:MAG: diguanylate cyclase [Thermodesulfobacteriota bacterium]